MIADLMAANGLALASGHEDRNGRSGVDDRSGKAAIDAVLKSNDARAGAARHVNKPVANLHE